MAGRDPVARAASDESDLHDVARWEPRTLLDRVVVAVHRGLVLSARGAVVLVGAGLIVLVGGFSAIRDPIVGALTALSVVPALGIAGYVWWADVTTGEPLDLVGATFLLAIATAGLAAVVNSLTGGFFGSFGPLGTIAFFFIVVGPVEETVKLLAVRLHAYHDDRFDAVVDGAVYGAVAGLGFAFIENALYITGALQSATVEGFGLVLVGGAITTVRALAGPGHVIYSALAGYYLGLAKFTPEYRGPLVVKGVLLATVAHALYNTLSTFGTGLVAALTGIPEPFVFVGFVLCYDGAAGLVVVRKLRAYRGAYRSATGG